MPAGSVGSAGDDPAYVNALVQIFRTGDVQYESYFSDGAQGAQLLKSPKSLAVYRRFAR